MHKTKQNQQMAEVGRRLQLLIAMYSSFGASDWKNTPTLPRGFGRGRRYGPVRVLVLVIVLMITKKDMRHGVAHTFGAGVPRDFKPSPPRCSLHCLDQDSNACP